MKQLLFLLVTMVFIPISCNDDIEKEVTEKKAPTVEIHTVYTTKDNLNKEKPDAESEVYIYYDMNVTYDLRITLMREKGGMLKEMI